MDLSSTQHAGKVWRITLFGGLAVQYGDKNFARFETRRAASLLACLAFYRHKRHAREELIEMLWPDEDPEATRLRFRQVLTSLRKTFTSVESAGDAFLLADRTFIALDADRVATDVAEFEAALKRAARQETVQARAEALTQAVGLYTGELLPGHYEEWVNGERRRLTESYVSALTDLAETLGKMGDTPAATNHIRKALLIDPLREESHCGLIRLYAGMGRSAEALIQYRELEQLLWKELRTLPSASSQALMEQVRAGAFVETPSVVAAPSTLPIEPAPLPSPKEEIPGGPNRLSFFSPSLAAPLTPFFGREMELLWLIEHLQPVPEENAARRTRVSAGAQASIRLFTLTGLGGSGKTRLALEAARHLQPAYQGAVWFVPLSERKDVNDLIVALADAVCGAESDAEDLFAQTITALAHYPALLILDNFEDLLPKGSLVVRTLLERLPGLKCLITSRQRLDIEGEQEYVVSPLPLPGPGESPDRLLEYAGIQLFVDRARRVRPGFQLDTQTAAPIAAICAQLEGIPLAIELAAAWSALLSPLQIQERLKQRFDLLVSRRKDIPERHRSLRAAIEGSFRNLEPEVQQFFARLSVFHGGWTLEAAEAVCDAPPALDYLAQLRQCSLVHVRETGVGMRFGMLELLREFAEEQLSAEETIELRRRHERFFVDLAERATPELTGPAQREWLQRLKDEYENLRFLLAESEKPHGDRLIGLRLFLALWRFWDVYGHYGEAEQWLERLPEKVTGIDPPMKARLLEAGGTFACNRTQSQKAQVMLGEALALYQAQGDEKGIAHALCALALAVRDGGDPKRARRLFEESIPKLQALGEPFSIGRALIGLGLLLYAEKEWETARALLDEGAAMYRICGHKKGLCFCLNAEGTFAFERGDLETARAYLENGLQLARSLEDARAVVYCLYNLAIIHYLQRDNTAAQACCQEALPFCVTSGVKAAEAQMLILLGDLACDGGDYSAAQDHYRSGLRICEIGDVTREMKSMIRRIAFLEFRRGNRERAIRLLSAVADESDAYLDLPEPLRLATQIDIDALRQQVGSEVFEKVWAQGSARLWDQVVQEAREAIME